MSDDERAALVERLRNKQIPMTQAQAAALIEADGKRLALAEKTIAAFRDWRVESDGYAGAPDRFDAVLDSYDAAIATGL